MNLHIVLNRDGRVAQATMLPDTLVPIWATPEARDKLTAELSEKGAYCTRCRTVARTSQLNNHICAEGVGCSNDIDADVIADENPARRSEQYNTIYKKMWKMLGKNLPDFVNPSGELGADHEW